jgi:hypothetical protein
MRTRMKTRMEAREIDDREGGRDVPDMFPLRTLTTFTAAT